MVANHQSLVDILILFRIFKHFKWVSKSEIFKIPFVGWNMSLNRYIKLKRGNMKSNLRMMKECEKNLLSGNSILIFPEGTRSTDGKVKTFKEGAFDLARKCKLPILPIVIQGTGSVLPKKGLVLRGNHSMKITILDEIPYSDFTSIESNTLAEKVRVNISTIVASG